MKMIVAVDSKFGIGYQNKLPWSFKSDMSFFRKITLNTLATSPLAIAGGEAGAVRSSVFEINKSSSNVNFITHVWSCCSDLLFADWAFGPEGRQEVKVLHRIVLSVISTETTTLRKKTKHVSVIDVDPCIEVRC